MQDQHKQDQHKEAMDQQVRQEKADKKVATQAEVVRKMNGSSVLHPEEQQLLNEMRSNKSSLDFNRAMLDYDEEHIDDKQS